MRKTTVREYDPQGNLVREVITEEADVHFAPVQQTCTCGNTSAWCPLHGQRGWWQWPVVTCASSVRQTSDFAVTYN